MITVKAIRIIDQFRSTIATLTADGWRDPQGLPFEDRDARALDAIAAQPDGTDLAVRGRYVRRAHVYITI